MGWLDFDWHIDKVPSMEPGFTMGFAQWSSQANIIFNIDLYKRKVSCDLCDYGMLGIACIWSDV